MQVFSEGPLALEFCKTHGIQVVILDLGLEGPWDGRKLIAELAQLTPPPPVILTTGDPQALNESKLLEAVEIVLPKPFNLDDLENAVRSVLSTTPAS